MGRSGSRANQIRWSSARLRSLDVLERLSFRVNAAFAPSDERLDGVTVAPLTTPLAAGASVQAAVFRLAPNGRIARHPADVPQIMAVLEGAGRVSGADGEPEPIAAGEAVFWSAGEEHETQTDEGMTALILEGDGLQPFRR
jgi:quercetin dioxygenase-like cupin family protein